MNLIENLPNFFLYFVLALSLFGAFVMLYLRLTPYAEMQLIRQGNSAAAVALLGAMLGFVLPLASCIAQSLSPLDMLVWGAVAMLVQCLVYVLGARLMPELKSAITQRQHAPAIFLAAISICVGLINAACMVY